MSSVFEPESDRQSRMNELRRQLLERRRSEVTEGPRESTELPDFVSFSTTFQPRTDKADMLTCLHNEIADMASGLLPSEGEMAIREVT
jgi:hypothetical protein